MFSGGRYFKNISRACLIPVYVSFYFVQLNVHFSGTPSVSYFTGDFVSQQSSKDVHSFFNRDHHKDSKAVSFRLNKRFHPSCLFITPEVLQDLIVYSYNIHASRLNETQALTSFSFNAPSLRGPPPIV